MADVEDLMFDIDQSLQMNGYPGLDSPTLKELHGRLQEPSVQQQLQSGQLTVERIVVEAMEALKGMGMTPNAQAAPGFAQEGGFINDASGRATQRARQQGFRVQPQGMGLPATPKSRIYGDVPFPGGADFQTPLLRGSVPFTSQQLPQFLQPPLLNEDPRKRRRLIQGQA